MWVCDLSGGLLGYAQFPGGTASSDGVVCDYAYFGDIGTASSPYDLGRTTTHEVGHWLNLRHIWGDSNCGNDFVMIHQSILDQIMAVHHTPQLPIVVETEMQVICL